MASIPCAGIVFSACSSKSINDPSSSSLRSRLGILTARNSFGWLKPARIGPSNGSRAKCWFKFGKNGVDAENAGIYGSQSRNDFNRDDVEQYFNYMGMLAVEGTYEKMEAMLSQKIHPVDLLLMMAASEGDKPKIEELLRAGADYTVKDSDGRTAVDRADGEDIRDFILGFSRQNA